MTSPETKAEFEIAPLAKPPTTPPTMSFTPPDEADMTVSVSATLATTPAKVTLLIDEKALRPNTPPTQLEFERTVPLR